LSFLSGNSNVRIRFQYKSNAMFWSPGPMGFRLDNFKVGSPAIDLVATDSLVSITADPAIPYFNINYTINNIGPDNCNASKTNFYWSTDNVFDALDTLVYSFTEPVINAFSSTTASPDIYYSIPLTQSIYYLFYKADNDSTVAEVNETNNVGSYMVTFIPSGISESDGSPDVVSFITNNDLNVQCTFPQVVSRVHLSLYNSSGQLLYNQEKNLQNKEFQSKISLEKMSCGIYFVAIYTDRGFERNIKFVISK